MANATIDTIRQVFSKYGIPKMVISDNGTQFKSKELKLLQTNIASTTIHQPKVLTENELIEHTVQTVKQCLKKSLKQEMTHT